MFLAPLNYDRFFKKIFFLDKTFGLIFDSCRVKRALADVDDGVDGVAVAVGDGV